MRFNKLTLRIASAVLTVCMMIGKVPAYAEAPEQMLENFDIITLDFRSEYAESVATGSSPMTATIEENGWRIYPERTAPSLIGSSSFSYQPYGISGAVNDARYAQRSEITVEFNVNKDGLYSVEFSGGQDPLKGALAAVFIDDVYEGNYDFGAYLPEDAEKKDIGETVNLSNISLEAGKHTVSFRRISAGEKPNNTLLMPGYVRLKRIDGLRGQVNLNFISYWDKGYLSSVASPDPTKATIEEDGWQLNEARTANNLLSFQNFYSKNYGLLAYVADQGYYKRGELSFDFEVDKDGTYEVDFGGMYQPEGGYGMILVDDIVIGGYDFGKQTPDFFIGKAENLLDVPLKAGRHTVSIRRVSGGAAKNALVPSYINFREIGEYKAGAYLNFVKYWDCKYAVDAQSAYAVNGELSFDGWSVNKDRTRDSLVKGVYFYATLRGFSTDGVKDTAMPRHSELSFDFTAPNDGTYVLHMGGNKADGSGAAAVFVDDIYMGNYDFGKADGKSFSEPEYIATTTLSAGKHTVTLRKASGAASTLRPAFINFSFTGEKRKEINIDFIKYHTGVYLNQFSAVPLGATMENDGWTIDKTETTAQVDPAYSPYGIYAKANADGDTMAVKFNVPTGGIYQMIFSGCQRSGGADTDIYLDDIGKVGEYSFLSSDGSYMPYGKQVSLGVHELSAGEHTLTIQRNDETNAIFASGGFRLIEVADDKNAPFALNVGELEPVGVGSEELLMLTGEIDGESVDMADAQIMAMTDDTQVAEASVSTKQDGSAVVTVKGISIGQTNLKVSAVFDGRVDGVIIPVEVAARDEFRKIVLSVDKSELEVGETATVTGKALNMIYEEIPLEKDGIYFKSSAPAVASVNNDGIITGRSRGNATITMYAQMGKRLGSATIDVAVSDFTPLVSAYVEKPKTVTTESDVQLNAVGILESENPADMSEANVEFELVSAEPADAATLTKSGVLSASKLGNVTVKATVSLGGVQVTTPELSISITEPVAQATVLNFTTNQLGTPADATFEKNGWKFNAKKSSNYLSDTTYLRYQYYGLSARIFGNNTPVADLCLDFVVPKAGTYDVEITYDKDLSGALTQVYVDGKYLGIIDFYNADLVSSNTIKLNSVELVETEGNEHNIIFHRINWESGPLHDRVEEHCGHNSAVFISAISFVPVSAMPGIASIAASADSEIYSAGESGAVNTEIKLDNGNSYYFGSMLDGSEDSSNKITYKSLNEDVVTVNAKGKIKAVAPGEATILVTATVGGKDKSTECKVKVDGQKIHAVAVEVKDKPLVLGEKRELDISATFADGRVIDTSDLTVALSSKYPNIVETSAENGKYYVEGKASGTSEITLEATLDGETAVAVFDVEVFGDAISKIEVSAETQFMRPNDEGTKITVTAKTYLGNVTGLDGAEIAYRSLNEEVATVDERGFVKPVALGETKIQVDVTLGDFSATETVDITIREGKVSSTYYTDEKKEAVRENVNAYSWAQSGKNAAVKKADAIVELGYDYIWNLPTTQELPRSLDIGYIYDPDASLCRYCGYDRLPKYGTTYSGTILDAINSPWKVQCPECRRRFPTNDFGKFYDLGIVQPGEEETYDVPAGQWSYDKAHIEHGKKFGYDYNEYKESGERLPAVGYLKNDMYPEVDKVKTLNGGAGLMDTETVEGWGVDDGFGYKTGRIYSTSFGPIVESHTYIAHYNHYALWYRGPLRTGLNALRDAYLMTGDAKYGRAGAIMVDRIADIYPYMYSNKWPEFHLSNGTNLKGRITGCIWEHYLTHDYCLAYDAFFPMYQDSQVISFLNQKAEQYGMENDKSTSVEICQNIEDGLLREVYKSTIDGNSYGNFGTHQEALAHAAVVLDTQPETDEWLEWLFQTGSDLNPPTGGNISNHLLQTVDRDGMGNESSPQYTNLWLNSLQDIAAPLAGYVTNPDWDIYKHPKVEQMQEAEFKLILARKATVHIGDSSSVAATTFDFYENRLLEFYRNTRNYKVGQMLYFLNGNSSKGLHFDMYTKNPNSLQKEIEDIISTYGEYDFDASEMMPGYGFSILRGGRYAKSTDDKYTIDTQQDIWMYFGQELMHGHLNVLNIGIEAFGLNLSPDNGYPEVNDAGDKMLYSNHGSLSHNTIQVDNKKQERITKTGNPMHFDDSDRVQLMDADVPFTYANTSVFRRSVLMIKVTDDISYYVDFFRVKGGDDHLYSFHALSDTLPETDEALEFVKQPMGSYAGPEVPVGTLGYSNGYSYFYDVHKAEAPRTGEFYADFEINDFRKTLGTTKRDIHLRMTMLNDFDLSEISLVKTQPPQKNNTIKDLQYVFARRTGNDLDTLFTTVFEPYEDERYITAMEQVSIVPVTGGAVGASEAKAIKVTVDGKREDYIIYAADKTREYIVDGKIAFCGNFGVYSMADGECVYSYVHDGTKIGETGADFSAATGEIVSFTTELASRNNIVLKLNQDIAAEELKGKYIFVNNDKMQNGAYAIVDAYEDPENAEQIVIDLGKSTLIRGYKDAYDFDAGYVYNIAKGQTFEIPLTYVYDGIPVLNSVSDKTATAGRKLTIQVTGSSQSGKKLKYFMQNAPRGVSFDEENGVLTWTPDDKQTGTHSIIIGVTDGILSDTQVVKIEVAASVGAGTPASDIGEDYTDNTGGTSGGGAAGGGMSSGNTSDDAAEDNADTGDTGDNSNVEDSTNSITSEKFIDLGNHGWAKEAVYYLVDLGVVNGTSHNTYSPANNIKRADFAIMLTRALGIKNGDGENFADVDASKYYAEELRLAKAAGIVNGVGNNNFNPEGEITRQDMMLMLYRALKVQGDELSEPDYSVLSEFTDAAQVSDYAKDAVSVLVKDGIIAGANGKLNPLAKATRAEIAVMLARVTEAE